MKNILLRGVAVLFGTALVYVVMVASFAYICTWKYNANFEEYSEEFILVKDYVINQYSCADDTYIVASFNKDSEEYYLYDPEKNIELSSSKEVVKAIETIETKAFSDKDANFDIIRIQGERISFCISNGKYALVYSPNEKPTWVNDPNEKEGVYVKEIADGWYHVVGK